MGIAANEQVAFRPSHTEEVGQKIQTGRNRHRLQLRHHVRHVTCDLKRLLWRDGVNGNLGLLGVQHPTPR